MFCKCSSAWIICTGLLMTGCAATREYPAPPPMTSLVEAGQTVGNDIQPLPKSSTEFERRNVLVLSGGGMNGAYTAGVLRGWTTSGSRPTFDVVTGVSTGALIAPLAFLGPEYDDELERLYTSVRRDKIFHPRLVWLDSVASSEPLEQLIAASATPDILHKIALAHRQGRRLYVGTTNLDTKRFVVWNLGAIAAQETPESRVLFQRVLLASCSVPGLFPPVPLNVEIDGKHYTELHVDGGVTASVFLLPEMLGIGRNGEVPKNAGNIAVNIIVAGKAQPDPAPAKRELLAISGQSMNAVLQAKMEGDLNKLFLLSRYVNADFRLAAIRQDYPLGDGGSMTFDQPMMQKLFQEGMRDGQNRVAWCAAPPGLEQAAFSKPRSGTRFTTAAAEQTPNSWTPRSIHVSVDAGVPAAEQR